MSKMRACIVTGWPVELDNTFDTGEFYDAIIVGPNDEETYFGSVVWDDTYVLDIPTHLYQREKETAEDLYELAVGRKPRKEPKMYLLCVEEDSQY